MREAWQEELEERIQLKAERAFQSNESQYKTTVI